MAFCKTCGAQIPDGMTQCTQCAAPGGANFSQQQAAAPLNPVDTGANMGEYDSGTAPGGDFNAPFTPEISGSNSKKGFIILGAAAVVLIALLVFLFNIFFCGYKKPIKNAVKGINKVDADKVIQAVIPKNQFKDFKELVEDKTGDSYKENVKELEDEINDTLKDTKLDYKVKVDFKGKKKVSKSTREDIEEAVSEMFEHIGLDEVEVKKAYRVKVKLEADVDYKKESASVGYTWNVYIVKYKGCSGWYIAPYGDEDSLGGWLDLAEDLGDYDDLLDYYF